MTEPTPVEEIWTFGGTRILNGKRCHAWLPPGADIRHELYFRPSGSQVPGSEYAVRVIRDGDKVSMYGLPTYHGQHSDTELRAHLEARHRMAETRLRLAAMERNDKRRSALDDALNPLCELIHSASAADRDALIAYVLRRLARAW